MTRDRFVHVALAALVLITPSLARAQSATTGAIAGTAKDTTGAVLPGVTVEAASPALIEKVRSVVTDSAGVYKITDLRPGTYSVTFTLPGFASVKHEGIDLTVGFTATVNAEMKVGGVEETVIVSGQSPIVDVQNVRTQQVLTREVIDAIPTAKSIYNMGALIPGMVVQKGTGPGQDVGGTAGETFQGIMIHGGRNGDQQILMDGMFLGFLSVAGGGKIPTALGDGTMEQTTVEISGHAAESESGGVVANMIPKQGGNTLRGTIFGNFGNESMQSDNYSDELKAKGLARPQPIKQLSDFNPSVGGPVQKDRLWFFSAYRDLRAQNYLDPTTRGYNLNPSGWTFVPDLNKKVVYAQNTMDAVGRGTWQINPKHKMSVLYDFNRKFEPRQGVGTTSTEQATYIQKFNDQHAQVTWSAPVTSRLLFDAGAGFNHIYHTTDWQQSAVFPAATESTTGLFFRGMPYVSATLPQVARKEWQNSQSYRGSMSYVTGSHAMKVGANYYGGDLDVNFFDGADYEVTLVNGAPSRVTYLPTPYRQDDFVHKGGIYAQDQWTLSHVTANLGLRFDWAGSRYPDAQLTATGILPARSFSGANVYGFKDLSPRLGASWDVFGNGKTAVKGSANRYVVVTDLIGGTRIVDPVNAAGGLLARTWTDANKDFIPQGDPLNPAANGEIGPSPNANFGKAVLTTTYDHDWATGFNTRQYEWEFSTGVQHQVVQGMSVNAAYFRRIYGNFDVTDNTLVAAADYDSFCVTAPRDSRLPGGGGNQICGFRDLNPSKLGRLQNVGQNNSGFGKQIEHWNGVDLGVNARLKNGTLLQGGISTGRTVTDNCAVFANLPETGVTGVATIAGPLAGPYCHQQTPFLTQFKLLGSYRLPWALQVSGTYQSIPGDAVSAGYVATNAEIVPTLRRNLSAGAASTVTVQIVPPGTIFGPRINQMDLRFTRQFTARAFKFRANLDVYNVGNINTPLVWNNTYGNAASAGAAWQRPSIIVSGRIVKVGGQIDF